MENIDSNLYECKHCNQTGTCKTGKDGSSCAACIKSNELKIRDIYFGLRCGSCGGLGKGEPYTERMNKRIKPILAVSTLSALVISTFVLALGNNPNFSAFLAFASTLSASIVTYYFATNEKK